MAFESTLSDALWHGREGQQFTYKGPEADSGRIQLGPVLATGLDANCRSLRRWETRGGSASAAGGIACRGRDGSWSVMLLPGTGS
jgi:surface antigen